MLNVEGLITRIGHFSIQNSAFNKKGHRQILTMPLRLLRATRLPSNSRLPAVNIQAACTLQ